jgi:predicted Zn-dependent protease
MSGAPQPPAFLSTHPNPDNRIENIHEEARARNCGTGNAYRDRYQRIKRLLN